MSRGSGDPRGWEGDLVDPFSNITHGTAGKEGDRFAGEIVTSLLPRKRKPTRPSKCQVDGCGQDLSSEKSYLQRYNVCDAHFKANLAIVGGQQVRFCQQCNKFQSILEFEGSRRSCVARSKHRNMRRRLASSATKRDSPDDMGSGGGSSPHRQRQNNSRKRKQKQRQRQRQQHGQGQSDSYETGERAGSGDTSQSDDGDGTASLDGGAGAGGNPNITAAAAAAAFPAAAPAAAALADSLIGAMARASGRRMEAKADGGGSSSGLDPYAGEGMRGLLALEQVSRVLEQPCGTGPRGGAGAGGAGEGADMRAGGLVPSLTASAGAAAGPRPSKQLGGLPPAQDLGLGPGGQQLRPPSLPARTGSYSSQASGQQGMASPASMIRGGAGGGAARESYLGRYRSADEGGCGTGGALDWGLNAFMLGASSLRSRMDVAPLEAAPQEQMLQHALRPPAGWMGGAGGEFTLRQLEAQQRQQHAAPLGDADGGSSTAALLRTLGRAGGLVRTASTAAQELDLDSLEREILHSGAETWHAGPVEAYRGMGQPPPQQQQQQQQPRVRPVDALAAQRSAAAASASASVPGEGPYRDDLLAMVQERRAALLRQQLTIQEQRQRQQQLLLGGQASQQQQQQSAVVAAAPHPMLQQWQQQPFLQLQQNHDRYHHHHHQQQQQQQQQALLKHEADAAPHPLAGSVSAPLAHRQHSTPAAQQLQLRLGAAAAGGRGSGGGAGGLARVEEYGELEPAFARSLSLELGGGGGPGGMMGQAGEGGAVVTLSGSALGGGAGFATGAGVHPAGLDGAAGLDAAQLLEHYMRSSFRAGGGGVDGGVGREDVLVGRVCLKLFSCTPGDLPADMLSRLRRWAGAAEPDVMQVFVRPGCVHVIANVRHTAGGAATLQRCVLGAGQLGAAVAALRAAFGSSGLLRGRRLVVQAAEEHRGAFEYEEDSAGCSQREEQERGEEAGEAAGEAAGEEAGEAAPGRACWVPDADMERAPGVVAMDPAVVICGTPTPLLLLGLNLLRPGTTFHARCAGRSYRLQPLAPEPLPAARAERGRSAGDMQSHQRPQHSRRLAQNASSPAAFEAAPPQLAGAGRPEDQSPFQAGAPAAGGQAPAVVLHSSSDASVPPDSPGGCGHGSSDSYTHSARVLGSMAASSSGRAGWDPAFASLYPTERASAAPGGLAHTPSHRSSHSSGARRGQGSRGSQGSREGEPLARAAPPGAPGDQPWPLPQHLERVWVLLPPLPRPGLVAVEAVHSELEVMGAWAAGVAAADPEAAEELSCWAARVGPDSSRCLLSELGVLLDYDAALWFLKKPPPAHSAAAPPLPPARPAAPPPPPQPPLPTVIERREPPADAPSGPGEADMPPGAGRYRSWLSAVHDEGEPYSEAGGGPGSEGGNPRYREWLLLVQRAFEASEQSVAAAALGAAEAAAAAAAATVRTEARQRAPLSLPGGAAVAGGPFRSALHAAYVAAARVLGLPTEPPAGDARPEQRAARPLAPPPQGGTSANEEDVGSAGAPSATPAALSVLRSALVLDARSAVSAAAAAAAAAASASASGTGSTGSQRTWGTAVSGSLSAGAGARSSGGGRVLIAAAAAAAAFSVTLPPLYAEPAVAGRSGGAGGSSAGSVSSGGGCDTRVPDAASRQGPLLHPGCRRSMLDAAARLLWAAVAAELPLLACGLLDWLLQQEGEEEPSHGGAAAPAAGPVAADGGPSPAADDEPCAPPAAAAPAAAAVTAAFDRVLGRLAAAAGPDTWVASMSGSGAGAAAAGGGTAPSVEGAPGAEASRPQPGSPLHLALACCSGRMVRHLLDWADAAGAAWPLAAAAGRGRVTPLHLAAARSDSGEAARLLLAVGGAAAQDAWLAARDAWGRTPAQMAAAGGLGHLNHLCVYGEEPAPGAAEEPWEEAGSGSGAGEGAREDGRECTRPDGALVGVREAKAEVVAPAGGGAGEAGGGAGGAASPAAEPLPAEPLAAEPLPAEPVRALGRRRDPASWATAWPRLLATALALVAALLVARLLGWTAGCWG